MKKTSIFAAIVAAFSFTAFAEVEMEKCTVAKEGKPEVVVSVPKGQCEKVNAGDFSGVSQEVKDAVEADHHAE